MAAPTPTPRTLPTGWKMPDGFKCLITLSLKPAINLWERDVKTGGMDGGEKIDTSTQHNIRWRTFQPRQLITLTDLTMDCAYDPDVHSDVLSILNVPQTITEFYPDGTTQCYYGYVQKFEKAALKEGEFPMATVTVTPTNWDATNNVEAAPVLTPASGT